MGTHTRSERVQAGGGGAKPPAADAVRRSVRTILASDRFTRSARGSALLRYVVDETLAGRGHRISATTIAQDVLGKDADFDSGADPLVRVQMGRMRALLAGWYEDHPGSVPVCISIPKGNYEPVFEAIEEDGPSPTQAALPPPPAAPDRARLPDGAAPAAPAPSSAPFPAPSWSRWRGDSEGRPLRLRPGHAVAACLVVALALVLFAIPSAEGPRTTRYPVLIVQPFENLTGDAANEALTQGLQRQLASDLQRFRTVRVALTEAPPPGMAASSRMAMREATTQADYALSGTILSADDELDFTVDLTDLRSGALLDRRRLRSEAEGDYFAVLTELSRMAIGRLAGGGGALERAAGRDRSDAFDMPAANSMEAFRCLVVFDEFTRVKTPERAEASYECLAAQVADAPRDSTLLAALAWTHGLVSPEAGMIEVGPWADDHTIEQALALAERAVAVGPGDDFAHEHLALLQWRDGQRDEAIRSLRRALALNPGNPNLSADLALYVGFMGEWDEAMRLSEVAYERSGNPPGWYALPRFYHALIEEDGPEALRLVDIVSPGDPFEPVYRLAAAVTAGDADAVAALAPDVTSLAAQNAGDPLRAARPWIRSDAVLGVLEERLAAAGVEVVGA